MSIFSLSKKTSEGAAGCSKRSSSKAAGEKYPEAYPLGYVEDYFDLRTTLGTVFSILLGEMGNEPIADRCGHLAKILPPSELVIGAWQEIQPLWTS
jgi:hypothetical protein